MFDSWSLRCGGNSPPMLWRSIELVDPAEGSRRGWPKIRPTPAASVHWLPWRDVRPFDPLQQLRPP
jgi:hypothetical protein